MAGRSDIEAGRAYVTLYLKNSLLIKGLQSIKQQVGQVGAEFMKLGRQVATVGIGIGVGLGFATKIFADFDDQMRAVKAVSGSTQEEFLRLTETAKNLGASTSFTAAQVAGIMTELGRAGFTADQIDKMTASVLNLSRATGTEAVESSGIMAATIRQFGLEATDAARVADGLTAAANKSFNSVSTLGEALSYAGPVAADLGMSLEETLAVLGALGNVGIQGSNAGTSLRRLATLGAAEADKLKEIFGVAFVDAAGNARPLVDALGEVNDATKNLGTAERAAKFNEAFGLLGITGASAISKNVIGVKDLHKAILAASGGAAKTAAEMDGGIGGSFRMLLSAAEGVAIAIGDALAPALKSIGDVAVPTIQIISRFIADNKQLVVTVAQVALGLVAAGGAFLAIGAALTGVAWSIGVLFTLGNFVGMLIGIVPPLIAVAGILGSIVAVGYSLLYIFPGLTAAAADFFGGISQWAANSFGPIFGEFSENWTAILATLNSGDMEGAARIAMAAVKIAVFDGMSATLEGVLNTWNAVGSVLQGIFDSISEGIFGVSADFSEAARSIIDTWQGMVTTISNQLLEMSAKGGYSGAIASQILGVDIGQEQAQAELNRQQQIAVKKRLLQQANANASTADANGGTFRNGTGDDYRLQATNLAKEIAALQGTKVDVLADAQKIATDQVNDMAEGIKGVDVASSIAEFRDSLQDLADKNRLELQDAKDSAALVQMAKEKAAIENGGKDEAAKVALKNPLKDPELASGIRNGFGTFSGAALALGGAGDNVQNKILKVAEQQKKVAEQQKVQNDKMIEQDGKLIKMFEKNFGMA